MPVPPVVRVFRGVVRRTLADWPVTLAAAVLLLAATTVVAADALYADAVTLGGLRRAIADAPADERNVRITARASANDVDDRNAIALGALAEALRSVGGRIVGQVDVSWLRPTDGSPGAGRLSGLRSYEPIEEHASLVDGRWPSAAAEPVEATLPSVMADATGLAVGDTLTIADSRDPSSPMEVELVGTWRGNPDDALWEWVTGDTDVDALQPLVMTPDDVTRLAVGTVSLQWWSAPNVEGMSIDDVEPLRRDAAGLSNRLRTVAPGESFTVRTNLPAIIDATAGSVLVTRAGILALGAQFAMLALYAVVLVAAILVERRRSESALLRARGATTGHLAAMAFGESMLLAVPVAAAAPWLASTGVRLLASATGSEETATLEAAAGGSGPLILAIVTAAVCVAALTLGAGFFGAHSARANVLGARPASRTLAQRLGIDLALLAVAAIGLWQLRTYGAPLTRQASGAIGIDPLLVAAPAVGLLAGALLANRFLPRVAELAERGLTRLRGLVAPLAARTVARRPLRYTRSALLLMLAVALATFAAQYTGTWAVSQSEQATYRAAGDVRVVLERTRDLPDWALASAMRSTPGVQQAVPVTRHIVRVGRAVREGELVAINPADARDLLGSQAEPLDALADAVPAVETFPIDGSPRRVSIVVDADVRPDPDPFGSGPPTDGTGAELPDLSDWRGIGAAVIVVDADGRTHRIGAPQDRWVRFSGEGQRIEIPLVIEADGVSLAPVPPVQLSGIEIVIQSPAEIVEGTVDLVAIAASDTERGDAWTSIAFDPEAPGWTWRRVDPFGDNPYAPPSRMPARLTIGQDDEPPIFGTPAGAALFRLWPLTQTAGELAAVASDTFLAQSGARIGDTLTATGALASLRLRIVGSIDTFPTLDPDEPFVIVDIAALELAVLGATGQTTPASEWWLDVAEGAETSVLESVRAGPYGVDEVIGRNELTDELSSDPVALGVIRVLGLGSLAAMAFAGIAFLVSATVATRERISEFAILRALGLSARQLATWLAMESAFLLAFGLLAGSAVGVLLGWMVLPFASFTSDGRAAVPVPTIVIPWASLAPLYAVAALLFVASLVVVRRQLPSVRISDVLRGVEGD